MKKIIKKIIFLLRRSFWTWRAKRRVRGEKKNIYVNRQSYFSKNTTLGKNVHFNGLRVIGTGNCSIGDNFHSGSGCLIFTHYHNYNSNRSLPYDNTYIVKDVSIKDNVWLGINVTVLPGVTIGEGCIIQAGSVVTKSIPDLAIAGGHPAQVFKYRDSEKYYKLKNEKRFF